MIYLIWGLLNVGLLIYFLTICINAIKLVRREIGLFAAIVFVIGLLSFCSRQNDDDKATNSNKTKTWTFTSEDSLTQKPTSFLRHELQSNLISKYELEVIYRKDRNNVNVPISAYISTNGFILGTNWKGESIFVDKTNDNNKFHYYVTGVVEWHLLGMTVYTQHKTFNGTVLTEKKQPLTHASVVMGHFRKKENETTTTNKNESTTYWTSDSFFIVDSHCTKSG